jgi:cysteine desulfurase
MNPSRPEMRIAVAGDLHDQWDQRDNQLLERLAPNKPLIPTDPEQRVRLFGLGHEICGELGFGWNRRLDMFRPAMASGKPVKVLPVDARGVIDLGKLSELLRGPGKAVVAIHHANNESGVIQPIREAATMVREADGWLHVDAIQSAGKIPVSMGALKADSLTLSAHKLGGPQGVGALVLGDGRAAVSIVRGAGQERGLRAGTENVPGIHGFGIAADCAARDLPLAEAHRAWRDAAETAVEAAGATIIGKGAPRLPNTLFLSVADWDSPQALIVLDLGGIMVSAGSACSSGKTKPSRTIVAMGRMDLATGGVRVSGGWGTTQDDWSRFADAWTKAYETHRARQTARTKEVA